jgi:hypothetical protein
MKSLNQYITEKIHELPKGVRGIVVFDIDDTLLKVDPNSIHLYKKDPNTGKEIALTTSQFALDPDSTDHKDWFDYRDFYDEEKVYQSIVNATPMLKNLKLMDAYIKAGYKFCFLTARGCEDTIKSALKEFLRYKDEDGNLRELENIFKDKYSHAINDEYKNYPGNTDAEKKANVLRDICKKFDEVIFVDDNVQNLQHARGLKLDNLKVLQAWK